MRYIMTAIWTFLLTHMLSYVAGALSMAPYDFVGTSLLAIGVIIAVYILGAVSFSPTPQANDN